MGPDVIGVLTGFGLVVVLPIVAILTNHQRKMAEIYARNQQMQHNPEVAALRQEIRELKEIVHQQAIAIDNSLSLHAKVDHKTELQQRPGGVL